MTIETHPLKILRGIIASQQKNIMTDSFGYTNMNQHYN